MTYLTNSGNKPDGTDIQIPLSGNAAKTTNVLGPNGTWSTGWLDTSNYGGIETTIYSDQDGSYVLRYSDNGGTSESLPAVAVSYQSSGGTRKGQFPPSATWIKFDYTNGSVAQTKFRFQVSLLTQQAQTSAETLNAAGSDTRTAQWTKTRLETKTSDGSNDYAPIYRNGNALRVYVDNQSAGGSVDTSTLATSANQTNGNQKTQVTNFPATQPVSGTVTVANPTTAPETGLAKDISITNGSAKTQVTSLPSIPAGTNAIGSVAVSNTVTVGGSVSVSNFPATQPVSGSVSVSNLPATQAVSGSISVSNFPSTQAVTGPATDTQLRATPLPVSIPGKVSTVEPTNIPSKYIPLNAATLVNNGDKVLHQMIIGNDASVTFLHLLDQSSATTPLIANSKWVLSLAANQAIVLDMMELNFTNGIVLYPSTSATALTLKSTSTMNVQLSSRAQ